MQACGRTPASSGITSQELDDHAAVLQDGFYYELKDSLIMILFGYIEKAVEHRRHHFTTIRLKADLASSDDG